MIKIYDEVHVYELPVTCSLKCSLKCSEKEEYNKTSKIPN